MSPGPVIILDTSVINRFAVDRKVGDPLMAALNSGYAVRLTATNVEEIIATRNGDERDLLLDVCKELLKGKNAEIIRPFHELIEILISEFERSRSFDWRRVSLGLPEYEREVALRELINDELSEKQRKYAADMAAEFEKVFRDARHHFEELFQAGAESRPSSVADLVSRLQVGGGAFWGFGKVLYRQPPEVPPDEETVRRFVDSCPPFHALLLALCVAQYDRCIREPGKRGQPAGRSDLFMPVCLPYCDESISDDRDQQNCLREVASLAKLAVKVRWFKEFRGSFEVDQSSSGAGSKKTAS